MVSKCVGLWLSWTGGTLYKSYINMYGYRIDERVEQYRGAITIRLMLWLRINGVNEWNKTEALYKCVGLRMGWAGEAFVLCVEWWKRTRRRPCSFRRSFRRERCPQRRILRTEDGNRSSRCHRSFPERLLRRPPSSFVNIYRRIAPENP